MQLYPDRLLFWFSHYILDSGPIQTYGDHFATESPLFNNYEAVLHCLPTSLAPLDHSIFKDIRGAVKIGLHKLVNDNALGFHLGHA